MSITQCKSDPAKPSRKTGRFGGVAERPPTVNLPERPEKQDGLASSLVVYPTLALTRKKKHEQ